MSRRRYVREREPSPEETRRILYWLRESDVSTWTLAHRFGFTESMIRKIRDGHGLKKRYVDKGATSTRWDRHEKVS